MTDTLIVGGVDGDPFQMPSHPVPPPVMFEKQRTFFVSFAWYSLEKTGGHMLDRKGQVVEMVLSVPHHGSILIQSGPMTVESVTEITAKLTADVCGGNQATILFWQELQS